MNLRCVVGIHAWGGCTCDRCGRTRESRHDWSSDCERCSTCGRLRSAAHAWGDSAADTCQRCGRDRRGAEQARQAACDELLGQIRGGFPLASLLVDERCRQFLLEKLDEGLGRRKIIEAFVKVVTESPARFLDVALMAARAADQIWAQLRAQLGEHAGSLSEGACKRKLLEELQAGRSAQEAVNNLLAAIKQAPQLYRSFTLNFPSAPTGYSGGYRRETTDKGAIGHDRRNVRTLSGEEWERKIAAAFGGPANSAAAQAVRVGVEAQA